MSSMMDKLTRMDRCRQQVRIQGIDLINKKLPAG
jgi:hypothetical protein